MSRITAFLESGLKVEITSEKHTWYADEPASAGGSDAGPTPYEMLLGSLAACTALTVRLYANHKGIDLQWIRSEYEFDKVHAEDCQQCENEDAGMIERVQAWVTLGGNFDEGEQKRLEQIVGRCPVHKTLTHGMQIFDQIVFVNSTTEPGSL